MESPFSAWESVFFVTLILSMAIAPLVGGGWWKKWYPLVTLAIALPCAVDVWFKNAGALPVVAQEYTSFIILIGSLYIVSGGIDVETPARGRPGSNTLFLLVGAVLANILGTTGASVVLIRPLLRANAWRKHKAHVFVFFIFLVSNMGGMLTPLGDPPLFLGYLHGVPLLWTLKLLPVWGVAAGFLLTVFWMVDRYQVRKEGTGGMAHEMPPAFQIHGASNVVLLGVVIASLFLPILIRDMVVVAASVLSVNITPVAIRERNDFTYHPIIEVAVLFAGLFVTMIPVQSLVQSSGSMGIAGSPAALFWTSGGVSSVLDNAPTYLIFFDAARHAAGSASTLVAGVPESLLMAVSAGCVMMGANTYIGNGPNLMIKAICEDEGVAMPSFTGYMAWAAIILIPLYSVVTWLFWV